MSGVLFLEILLGLLVIVCGIITNAALWPTRPRSHAAVSRQTGRPAPPSWGADRHRFRSLL